MQAPNRKGLCCWVRAGCSLKAPDKWVRLLLGVPQNGSKLTYKGILRKHGVILLVSLYNHKRPRSTNFKIDEAQSAQKTSAPFARRSRSPRRRRTPPRRSPPRRSPPRRGAALDGVCGGSGSVLTFRAESGRLGALQEN